MALCKGSFYSFLFCFILLQSQFLFQVAQELESPQRFAISLLRQKVIFHFSLDVLLHYMTWSSSIARCIECVVHDNTLFLREDVISIFVELAGVNVTERFRMGLMPDVR